MGWWVINSTPWPLYSWEGDPVPIGQEVGWAPGSVCSGTENLTTSRIQSPEYPASLSHNTDYALLAHIINNLHQVNYLPK